MSNIKERVLLIAESKGISKTEFFKELGLSYANFKGIQKQSALSSDAIDTILSKHPDVNPAWLIIEEGSMYRQETANVANDNVISYKSSEKSKPTLPTSSNKDRIVKSLEQTITALQQTVLSQEKTIHSLEQQIAMMRDIKKKM